jgi:hypothetical protein
MCRPFDGQAETGHSTRAKSRCEDAWQSRTPQASRRPPLPPTQLPVPNACPAVPGDEASARPDGRNAGRLRATARWPGPRGGTSDAAAGRTMAQASGPPGAPGFGDEPGTCPAPQAGEFTVARTCVLIKTASHPRRTCVLIICMSQATYGPWPRSDVIPWCRQNGRGALPGTVGRSVTCHDGPGAAAAARPGRGEARHPRADRARRPAAAGLGRSREPARPLPTNARARPAEPR